MRMKALQLFLILLFALIFCGCLGKFMREGMENNEDSDHESDHEDNEYKRNNMITPISIIFLWEGVAKVSLKLKLKNDRSNKSR